MNLLRGPLLAASDSPWLYRQATRRRFVRRAVSRFMPGETLDEGLGAATRLRDQGLSSILTYLGENVGDRTEAEAVVQHYLQVLDRIRGEAGLDAEVSIKLTQLGLDLAPELACENAARIVARARELGRRVWIDMESTRYTDVTLEVFDHLRSADPRLGVALQAYLHRTPKDVERLLPLGAAIRLVKGAYREPPDLAMASKRDVDESYYTLATRLLDAEARRAGVWVAVATHDLRLIGRIQAHLASQGVSKDQFEFAMLYGIQRSKQIRLVKEGYRTRVLISYGSHWFPWYMRRLAERPANLLFVLRNALAG